MAAELSLPVHGLLESQAANAAVVHAHLLLVEAKVESAMGAPLF